MRLIKQFLPVFPVPTWKEFPFHRNSELQLKLHDLPFKATIEFPIRTMNRRSFLKTSAGITCATGTIPFVNQVSAQHSETGSGKQQFLELRHFSILSGDKKKQVDGFLKQAVIPALNRRGIQPVGVFHQMPEKDDHSIYMLVPYQTLDQFSSITSDLAADETFLEAGSDYLNSEKKDPPYTRVNTTLMKAFTGYPKVKTPRKGERFFELRTYESHNEKKAILKVEMFNTAELAIFEAVGLDGVFYGETLAGPDMPNLNYMLAYKNKDERKKSWQAFSKNPDWQTLKKDSRFKDTVSNIRAVFLQPAPYSQI